MSRHEFTFEELTAELRTLRETPSEQFAAALDARAAAGFPRAGGTLPAARAATRAIDWLREAGPRRRLLPVLAGATTVIVVATAIVVATEGNGGGTNSGSAGSPAAAGAPESSPVQTDVQPPTTLVAPERPKEAGGSITAEPALPTPGAAPAAPGVRKREIERSAELTLGADPDQVRDVSAKVFEVVRRYRGIVLSSSVRDGGAGDAGATYQLLIPSPRLGAAMADLSALAEVRSRSENTLDITAPFVSARDRLRNARAEEEGLLRQLAGADTDAERESVKAQLRIVHGRIAASNAHLDRLRHRANFSHVSLQIVSGEDGVTPIGGDTGGDWTIGDALHDAGRVLAVAAGVTLVALAVLAPLALLGGAGWTARRLYVRRAREQALGAKTG
jgi:Domain of unknown function (DUF4349)